MYVAPAGSEKTVDDVAVMPLFKITLGNVTVYGAENVVVLVIVWFANDAANMN